MKGLARICFALLVLFQYTQCLPRIDPLVDTKVGLIRGLRADDGNYSKFLGIPYAQVNPDNPFGVSAMYFNLCVYKVVKTNKICKQFFK